MKRFFKGILAACMVLALVFSAPVTALGESADPKPEVEKHSIYVANETRDITIGFVCVVAKNKPDTCLYSGVTLYPRSVSEKDDNKVSSFVMCLPAGEYMLFMASADRRTQEVEKHYLIFVVEGDGTLIFEDEETDV